MNFLLCKSYVAVPQPASLSIVENFKASTLGGGGETHTHPISNRGPQEEQIFRKAMVLEEVSRSAVLN